MKTYTTFICGQYAGEKTMKEIYTYLDQAHYEALNMQSSAEHVIYGYFRYTEDGDIDAAHVSILEKDEKEFDRIAMIPNHRIFAIHKRH